LEILGERLVFSLFALGLQIFSIRTFEMFTGDFDFKIDIRFEKVSFVLHTIHVNSTAQSTSKRISCTKTDSYALVHVFQLLFS
jgi:hypothetical protein